LRKRSVCRPVVPGFRTDSETARAGNGNVAIRPGRPEKPSRIVGSIGFSVRGRDSTGRGRTAIVETTVMNTGQAVVQPCNEIAPPVRPTGRKKRKPKRRVYTRNNAVWTSRGFRAEPTFNIRYNVLRRRRGGQHVKILRAYKTRTLCGIAVLLIGKLRSFDTRTPYSLYIHTYTRTHTRRDDDSFLIRNCFRFTVDVLRMIFHGRLLRVATGRPAAAAVAIASTDYFGRVLFLYGNALLSGPLNSDILTNPYQTLSYYIVGQLKNRLSEAHRRQQKKKKSL